MPMIDVFAPAGTFPDQHALAGELARTLKEVEGVPDIALFRENTAAFIHELPAAAISDATGASDHVRVQVLTNAGALNRDQQLAAVQRLTEVVAQAATDPSVATRTWVLLTEAPDGGWGIAGHANTNAELVSLARHELGLE